MIRLYFYVEGQTEQAYAQTVLREHLSGFSVMVEGAVLAATKRRHRVVFRGGGRHYAPMKNDLRRFLQQHRGPEVRVTTMFDLYGLARDFPGTTEADQIRHLPLERVQILEEVLSRDIDDQRVVPHIQLHEFETILFCELEALAFYFDDCSRQIEALRAGAGQELATPELIDDGQASAPSKRIAKYFPEYPARKMDAAVEIASAIDLTVIRAKCAHLDHWLTTLENLGGS